MFIDPAKFFISCSLLPRFHAPLSTASEKTCRSFLLKNLHIVLRYDGLPLFAEQGDKIFSNLLHVEREAGAETVSERLLNTDESGFLPSLMASVRAALSLPPPPLLALTF